MVLMSLLLLCLFFSGMFTVSEADFRKESASGYCGHCMEYWDRQHYDYSYQKWKCSIWWCLYSGYDVVDKTPNNMMSCWPTYNDDNPTMKLCWSHTRCKTCNREQGDRSTTCRRKSVKIVTCDLCDTEIRRETTLDIPTDFECPPVVYYTETKSGTGPGECCEPCVTCQKKVKEAVHERPHKKKYECCTKDAGTITMTGQCGTEYLEDMMKAYCGTCICGYSLVDVIVGGGVCVFIKGFPLHTKQFHATVTCTSCKESWPEVDYILYGFLQCSHFLSLREFTVATCSDCE